MRIAHWCLGALFIPIWSAGAQIIEVPLKIQEGSNYLCMSEIKLSHTKPEGVWKLPDLMGKQTFYGFAALGKNKRLVILASPKTQGMGENQVYFDANGDGDLTNEGAIRLGQPSVSSVVAKPYTTKSTINRKSLPYVFNIDQRYNIGSSSQNASVVRLIMHAQYTFEGQFTFDGQQYRVSLDDTNLNEHVDDTIEPGGTIPTGYAKLRDAYRGDVLLLRPQGSNGSYYDHCILGKWIGIKKQLFTIQIDDTNQKIVLTPVTNDVVTVKLPYETERLWLVSEDGRESISYFSPGSSLTVPKGKYRIMEYTISKKDEQGDLWMVRGAATAKTPVFSVENTGTVCSFGEPFTPKTEVMRSGNANPQLQFYVLGASQEVLRDIRHVSGTQSKIGMTKGGLPKEPTYKIVKEDGEVSAQGNFEYG